MVLNYEDYLLVIWEYSESIGKASEADISRRLKITLPTVNEYIGKLAGMGLVEKNGREIRLTRSGKKVTVPVVRAHRIAEVFALKFLEVEWEEVHSAVMDLEHLFSGTYGDNLYKHLGYPERCPHGNPIGITAKGSRITPVSAAQGEYVLDRITLELHDTLSKLADISAFPGTRVRLYREGGVAALENDQGKVSLTDVENHSIRLRKPAAGPRKVAPRTR
ncbi:MAG: metal-dependent transcriptional regulator [Candidatus Thermoplasmatota archaeon]|nr:metal-dependent transcriptional regulator [Candidatus Thermoplasmatota archaeon]